VDLKAYYDQYWISKDDSYDRGRLALLLDRIPESASCLEINCGPGILGKLLREKGIEVVGVDLSSVALRRAHKKGVLSVQCDPDGEPLPFKDNSFKWAVSNSSLEHLFQPDEALSEISRVVAPGGSFLWMVPNIGHWRYRLWLLFGKFPVVPNSPTDLLHIRMYTRSESIKSLKAHGFRVKKVTGSGGVWVPKLYPFFMRTPGLSHLYERLAPLWPSLLCRYLVLEAQKVGS